MDFETKIRIGAGWVANLWAAEMITYGVPRGSGTDDRMPTAHELVKFRRGLAGRLVGKCIARMQSGIGRKLRRSPYFRVDYEPRNEFTKRILDEAGIPYPYAFGDWGKAYTGLRFPDGERGRVLVRYSLSRRHRREPPVYDLPDILERFNLVETDEQRERWERGVVDVPLYGPGS